MNVVWVLGAAIMGFVGRMLVLRVAWSLPPPLQDPMELAVKARWCRHYAELNYLALRKIAKKRDRLLGGKVGEEFMQVSLVPFALSLRSSRPHLLIDRSLQVLLSSLLE